MKNVCEALGFITAALALVVIGTGFNVTAREASTPEQVQALAEVVWALCQG